MFYAGIDIAKRNHEAAVIGKDGQALVESLSFPNSQAGCEKFCQLLERLSIPKQELIIAKEQLASALALSQQVNGRPPRII